MLAGAFPLNIGGQTQQEQMLKQQELIVIVCKVTTLSQKCKILGGLVVEKDERISLASPFAGCTWSLAHLLPTPAFNCQQQN